MTDQTDNLLFFPGRHYSLDRIISGTQKTSVMNDVDFATPWKLFDLITLAPDLEWQPVGDDAGEEGVILLDGTVEITYDSKTSSVAAPTTILFPVGKSARLRQEGTALVRLLHVQVALTPVHREPRNIQLEAVDLDQLKWRDAIHGGTGRIATRHIWGPADFNSSWTFMDHAVLGPQGSVGYHYHDALEECFVILSGHGFMSIDDQTFTVGPGSVTWQGINQAHGIYNPYDIPLNFLRLAVAQPNEEYTTIDLHDDLTGRHPDGQKD